MSFDHINDRAPLDAAQRLAIQHEVETLGLAGKRIRVLRALTFEGDAGMVMRQLAQSLPVGTREWGKPTADGARPLSLTIVQGEIEIVEVQSKLARIHLFDIDPAELVGIAPCDDGSPGWVVMHQTGDGMREPYKTEPVCDDIGQLVYFDVQDAAEVCLSGKFWKHDMGEGEPDELTSQEPGYVPEGETLSIGQVRNVVGLEDADPTDLRTQRADLAHYPAPVREGDLAAAIIPNEAAKE